MPEVRIVDPGNVAETLICGPFNCSVNGSFATLIFTHERLIADKLMGSTPEIKVEAVVRARLVMPVEGLKQLRDSIDRILRNRQAEGQVPGSLGNH
ncbi:hypothetical protein [Mesorhizobium sp. NPDC059025]|uniref:hypothetical protein n=1 Tax=unclassified Mesorhizobium TaxID=325217 RepID=UPI0036AA7C11